MKKKHILLSIIFLILTSFVTLIDTKSQKYIDDSLVEASIAYGSARVINASVSVLQTAEVSIPLIGGASITIGEILDPLNDLIERFSDVMFTVIGSLMLQEILLMIVTKPLFKFGLIAFGVLSGIMILIKNKPYARFSFKVFLVFVVFRFSMAFVLLSNSFVANMFLLERVHKSNSNLENSGTNFKIFSAEAMGNPKYYEYTTKMTENTKLIIENQEKLAAIKLKLKGLEAKNTNIFFDTDEMNEYQENVSSHENLIKDLEDENKDMQDKLEGEDSLKEQMIKIKESLRPSEINEKVEKIVNGLFELIMLFILQTILIPIAFLFILRSVVKSVWNYELEFDTIENESKDNLIETNIVNNKQLNQ